MNPLSDKKYDFEYIIRMKKVRKKILQMSTKLPKTDEFYKKLNRRNWFLR